MSIAIKVPVPDISCVEVVDRPASCTNNEEVEVSTFRLRHLGATLLHVENSTVWGERPAGNKTAVSERQADEEARTEWKREVKVGSGLSGSGMVAVQKYNFFEFKHRRLVDINSKTIAGALPY